jgi:hypothetical protein
MSAHDEPGNEAQRQLLHAEDTSGTDNNLGDGERKRSSGCSKWRKQSTGNGDSRMTIKKD